MKQEIIQGDCLEVMKTFADKSLDFQLALELQRQGFPLHEVQQGCWHGEFIFRTDNSTSPTYYAPTLEELIEACGEDFFTLSYVQDWQARSAPRDEEEEWGHEARGSTPTEAVARLWLALNPGTPALSKASPALKQNLS